MKGSGSQFIRGSDLGLFHLRERQLSTGQEPVGGVRKYGGGSEIVLIIGGVCQKFFTLALKLSFQEGGKKFLLILGASRNIFLNFFCDARNNLPQLLGKLHYLSGGGGDIRWSGRKLSDARFVVGESFQRSVLQWAKNVEWPNWLKRRFRLTRSGRNCRKGPIRSGLKILIVQFVVGEKF